MPAQPSFDYTAAPYALVPVENDAGDLLYAVAEALGADERAAAPVTGYDYERQIVDAIFQVSIGVPDLVAAARIACGIFDHALHASGMSASTLGLSIVAGNNPEMLL